MQKVPYFLIISLLFFSACGKSCSSDKTTALKNTASSLEDSPASGGPAFESFLKNLPENEVNSIGKAAAYFDKEYANEPAKACDMAWENFDKFVDRVVENFNDSPTMEKYRSNPQAVSKIITDKGVNMNFDAFTKQLAENGISFYMSEGDLYAKNDMQYEWNHFEARVSPEMRTFLQQLTTEDQKPVIEDAGLMISYQEVAERAVFWDEFALKNPSMKVNKLCENRFRSYLHTLVTEYLDNAPLFDAQSHKLLPQVQVAYEGLIKKTPNTRTGKEIAAFYALLKKKNFLKDSEVEAKMEEIEMKKYPFLRQ